MRSHWKIVLVISLLVVAGRAARAADVSLQVSTSQPFVNEPFVVEIEISNFQEAAEPAFPELANGVVRQRGGVREQSQIRIINGRRTAQRSRSYAFEITPTRVGTLTIPAVAVEADGQVYETRPRTLQVRPSNAEELFSAAVVTDRERVFVNQQFELKLLLSIKAAYYGTQRLPLETLLRRINVADLGPFPRQYASTRVEQRRVDGNLQSYFVVEFSTPYVATRPGPLEFPEILLGMNYPVQTGNNRNLRVSPTMPDTQVLPIPQDGRPPHFNGAVGLYAIDARATPTSVRVGDPIDLVIEIYGEGPIETLPPPLLSGVPELAQHFRLPDDNPAGEVVRGRRRYAVTIRAQTDKVDAIPPIEYPYFDPDAERFVIASSKPIPLDVAPAAEIEAPVVAAPAGGDNGRGTGSLAALDGLHDIETDASALLATTGLPQRDWILGGMFAPAAAFVLAWLGLALFQRHAADTSRRRRSGARRAALREMQSVATNDVRGLATTIINALGRYLGDRVGEPPGRFTGMAAVSYLEQRGAPAEVVEQTRQLIARCEEVSFAGGASADRDALLQAARDCLARLERVKL